MTLTTNGKNYIANNFGINSCFSGSGLTWIPVDINNIVGAPETGSTAQIVARLITTAIYKEIRVTVPAAQAGTYTNALLIAANDEQIINSTDITFINTNDGAPVGEPQYCIGACVPLWQCEIPLNGYESDGCGNRRLNTACDPAAPGRAGTYEFIGPPSGDPSVDLDLTDLEMRQSLTDYHFEMNDMAITNTSTHRIYVALEVRLFAGALTTCPTTGASFIGMDRVSTSRAVRIKIIDPGEVMPVNADFYQPATIQGVHTVCLLVHGTWTRVELEAEIAGITG